MKTLNQILREGLPVSDPAARSKDLDFFLSEEPEEDTEDLHTLTWVEADVPIQLFGCNFTLDELGPVLCDPWYQNREKEREAMILAWVEATGGWQAALNKSPVLAVVRHGVLKYVDGWHRTKLARQSGETTVHTLIGFPRVELPSTA